jgi:hypothetical protein
MFDLLWSDISSNSILNYDNMNCLHSQLLLCGHLDGATAEIGVYEGTTSKMIISTTRKPHYCYDTFEGIVGSSSLYGDKHENGEFVCHLEQVKKNINVGSVIYKKGWFPDTFQEENISFCFVYSNTATYLGTKNTLECFTPTMVSGGKIVFYVDNNCLGVSKAIREFVNDNYSISYTNNFVIFTSKG